MRPTFRAWLLAEIFECGGRGRDGAGPARRCAGILPWKFLHSANLARLI